MKVIKCPTHGLLRLNVWTAQPKSAIWSSTSQNELEKVLLLAHLFRFKTDGKTKIGLLTCLLPGHQLGGSLALYPCVSRASRDNK